MGLLSDHEETGRCAGALPDPAIPALRPGVAARAREAPSFQRPRAALQAGRPGRRGVVVHVAAVNQSRAVMSSAGASPAQLLAIADVTVGAPAGAARE